jgi:hypothetical protein
VRGLIFLISIIFYLYIDPISISTSLIDGARSSPASRGTRFGRGRLGREASGICSARPEIGQEPNARKPMTTIKILLPGTALTTLTAVSALADEPLGKGLTMYIQMG